MAESFHMTSAVFRRHGKEWVDWIADYLKTAEHRPVLARTEPGAVYKSLPEHPPEDPEPHENILRDLEEKILPGITHWQSPNFFAYFPANSSGPSVLGDLLSSGLGVQGMLWATSPACTELETRVLDWLAEMLGLPADFRSDGSGGGVIQDSASSSNLVAMLAARERATGFSSNERGCDGTLVAYTSTQAHSSFEKAAKVAGIGRANLRTVEVDEAFRMRPEALESAISADLAAGRKPFFVGATMGTTSSLAFDPLDRLGEVCRRYGLWLHVDAAMAGTATLCPEFRHIQKGIEQVDSYCFDAHKWMFTNFDCSCFFTSDRKTLVETLSVLPEFLRNTATMTGAVTDYRDWHIPLGRRFRALKLWFVIRHYGVKGLQHHVRQHVALAQRFRGWVEGDSRFELCSRSDLNLVCFRLRAEDQDNEALLERLNRSGRLYLSHTRLGGRFVLRFCVGQTYTEARHVEAAWQAIQQEATAVLSGRSPARL